jgi:hypothetical protein
MTTGEAIETFWSKFKGLVDRLAYMTPDEYVDTISRSFLLVNIATRRRTLHLLVEMSERAHSEYSTAVADLDKELLDYLQCHRQLPTAGEIVALKSLYGIARAPTLVPVSLEADVFGRTEELQANENLLTAMKEVRRFGSGSSSFAIEVARLSKLVTVQRRELAALKFRNPSMMEPTVDHMIEYKHNKIRALKDILLEQKAQLSIIRSANERGHNHYLLTVKQKAANRTRQARLQAKIKSDEELLQKEEASFGDPCISTSERLESAHVDLDMRIVKAVERCKRSFEELTNQLPLELRSFKESCQNDAQTLLQGAEAILLSAKDGILPRSAHGAAVLLREHAKTLLNDEKRAGSTQLTSLPNLPASPASELLRGITEILEARKEKLGTFSTMYESSSTDVELPSRTCLMSPVDCAAGCCPIKTSRCESCLVRTADLPLQVSHPFKYKPLNTFS